MKNLIIALLIFVTGLLVSGCAGGYVTTSATVGPGGYVYPGYGYYPSYGPVYPSYGPSINLGYYRGYRNNYYRHDGHAHGGYQGGHGGYHMHHR